MSKNWTWPSNQASVKFTDSDVKRKPRSQCQQSAGVHGNNSCNMGDGPPHYSVSVHCTILYARYIMHQLLHGALKAAIALEAPCFCTLLHALARS